MLDQQLRCQWPWYGTGHMPELTEVSVHLCYCQPTASMLQYIQTAACFTASSTYGHVMRQSKITTAIQPQPMPTTPEPLFNCCCCPPHCTWTSTGAQLELRPHTMHSACHIPTAATIEAAESVLERSTVWARPALTGRMPLASTLGPAR